MLCDQHNYSNSANIISKFTDTVYGGCGYLRRWLQEQRQAYVLALACNDGVDIVSDGVVYPHVPIKDLAPDLFTEWHRLSAGSGAKGERWFDWTLIPLAPSGIAGWSHWLLVRRHIHDKTEWSYYLIFAPSTTTFSTMVQVAGRRWRVEESLELGKGEVGLDQYEVRTFVGWYRHITLAMLALAYLVVVRSRLGTESEKGATQHRSLACNRSRSPPIGVSIGVAASGYSRTGAVLVRLATTPSGTSQEISLHTSDQSSSSLSAAVVLDDDPR